MGPFKAEINTMIDHFDTLLKTDQIEVRTEFMEQFRRIDALIRESLKKIRNDQSPPNRRRSTAEHSTSTRTNQDAPHPQETSSRTNNESIPTDTTDTYHLPAATQNDTEHSSLNQFRIDKPPPSAEPITENNIRVNFGSQYDPTTSYYPYDYYSYSSEEDNS